MKKPVLAFLVLALLSSMLTAGEPLVWSVNSRADVLKGDARGVSIDDTGSITLAPKLSEVFKTEQPYIWSTASDAVGNVYLGTGGDGKIFKVDAAGVGTQFVDLAELNVSALAISSDGVLYAATSPDGKVYRISTAGKAESYFEPREKYIWSLAVLPDGSLAVGSGDNGKIFKVKSGGASPESSVLYDTNETHIITLATDKAGNLYAGSDANGIVYRFGLDGKPFALIDSPLREIHSLAVGPDGSIYALALGDSASAPKPSDAAAVSAPTESKTVSADRPSPLTPEPAAKSRYDLSAAKSAVYRIAPDGANEIIWSSGTVIGFSLFARPDGGGVYIGTSDKGRIYSVSNQGRESLLAQTGASQISTMIASRNGIWATSSNQGSLYRVGSETVADGTYESAVLDAKSTASWGRIWSRSAGNVSIQTRSGNTEKPDETWSSWSPAIAAGAGGQVQSPTARYFQWRATLKAGPAPAAVLNEVSMAFAARNIAPEVLSIQVLPTNVGLVANPPVQIDPNIELSGMDPVTFGLPVAAVAPRRVFQRGATSLQWTAEDRNGDKLVYDVYYREAGESVFKLLRGDLNDNFLAIDGQSLADGRYVFKVVARDSPSNPGSLALAGERSAEPVDIDNTPPTVTAVGKPQIKGDRTLVTFEAKDASSYLTRAEYSINGGVWLPLYAEDGISDSPAERYTIEAVTPAAGEYAVTLRVYDANANSGNARVVVRK